LFYNHNLIKMPKRHRVSQGDEISQEISQLHSQVSSYITERTLEKNSANGNREVILDCKAKGKFKSGRPTLSDITDLLFPRYKFMSKSYGQYSTVVVSGTTETLATETANTNHYMVNTQNKQQFVQFLHLPVNNRDVNHTSTGRALNSIIYDTIDKSNISQSQVAGNGDPLTDLQRKYRSMFYNGGFTEHIFYNPGNVEITFEIWEARPKRFLLTPETPLVTIALDKSLQGSGQTGFATSTVSGGTAPSQYLQPTSMDFTLSVHDHMAHDKFQFSNNRKIRILGGETVKVIVRHPPFKLTGSTQLNSMAYGNYLEQLLSTTNDLAYTPFSTVWLLCRFHGQIETNDPGTATDSGYVGNATKVVMGVCQLAHMQREFHRTRVGYQQNTDQTYEYDGWTDALSSVGNEPYIANPLTDTVDRADV